MNIKKAIEVLEYHQQWRLGDDDIVQTNARELTESINIILVEVKKVINTFYCQSEIEGGKKCETQCEHCKEYYKPLSNNK